MSNIIIGLGHRARVGKDTVGRYLVEEYGFKRYAFADVLKKVCGTIVDKDPFDEDFKTEDTICGITGGQLLQRVGVALRDAIDDDIWIEASGIRQASQHIKRIVITDVRFQNEALFIWELGGEIWKITRPGIALDSHASDSEGDQIKWDHTIHNSESLELLLAQVEDRLQPHLPITT